MSSGFFRPISNAQKRTMKKQKDIETPWESEQGKHFNAAVGYYELGMLDNSEAQLNEIDTTVAGDSVPVIALRLGIAYSRKECNEMKALARRLLLLDPSNPHWSLADGYSKAKIDSD